MSIKGATRICPRCGAPMDQHSFVDTCSYCGYVLSVSSDNSEDAAGKYMPPESPKELYEYITRHLSYIQSCCPVEVQKTDGTFLFKSKTAFSPNDGKEAITRIKLKYEASISENSYQLLLTFNSMVNELPRLFLRINSETVLTPSSLFHNGHYAFELSIESFRALCEANVLEMEMAPFFLLCSWDEFKTYSRRFYHSLIDRNKYYYCLFHKLITD